ncbi:MAG: UDP-3-O-acyl-N-acetylglucosamine deacetylase [Pseudomonadota bacterium]
MYRTLAKPVLFEGTGLHGGQKASAKVCPAEPGHGIWFMRTDLPCSDGMIEARYDLVSDTRLCTRLTNVEGASVSTIEHLMAALFGCGVSDALVRIDGPEIPILDGSAMPFVTKFRKVGMTASPGERRGIKITRPIVVENEGRKAALMPSAVPAISVVISFADPAIGTQSLHLDLNTGGFASELADCRTFCLLSDVEALRRIGLARGGGLENAIVVDKGRVLNPEGLRRPDEFVRHKMLDAVGDLALAGAPIIGRYEGELIGHEMTNRLLHALFSTPTSWEWCDVTADDLPSLDGPEQFEARMPVTMAV